MSKIIQLPTFSDTRGKLTVIENCIPFDVKRIYYIYDANGSRGGHRHQKTRQALISIAGSCDIYIDDSNTKTTVTLNKPSDCLILEPQDWHTMSNFVEGTVLLVLASELYDVEDYIDEPYN